MLMNSYIAKTAASAMTRQKSALMLCHQNTIAVNPATVGHTAKPDVLLFPCMV